LAVERVAAGLLRADDDVVGAEALDLPLGGAFTGSNAIERPDRLLITQEPEDIDTGDLTMYPWLGRVEEE